MYYIQSELRSHLPFFTHTYVRTSSLSFHFMCGRARHQIPTCSDTFHDCYGNN